MHELEISFNSEPIFSQKQRPCKVYHDIEIKSGEKPQYVYLKHYYVASVSVWFKETTDDTLKLAVKDVQLMQDPHSEADAVGQAVLKAEDMSAAFQAASTVSGLRVYLSQPSPLWASFRLMEVRLFSGDVFHIGEEHATRVSTTTANSFHELMGLYAAKARVLRTLRDCD